MLVLDNKMVKMLLILVAAGVLVFASKSYEKQLGSDVTYSVMGLVSLAALYALFVVNTEEEESFQANMDEALTDSDGTETDFGDMDMASAMNATVDDAANTVDEQPPVVQPEAPPAEPAPPAQETSGVMPSEPLGDNEEPKSVEDLFKTSNTVPDQCYPKDILNADDLLPKNTDSTWAQSVPASQGALTDQNFLNAGYHIGVNTVGQTLRNANRQLRSDPPCPRTKVSPWLQSTIEPDTNRKPLEIGA
tara:strand:- start:1386 stop:2129 length:744 start_codon:yes stop_codon:yes gene_type:complete